MNTQQPEALRLADELEMWTQGEPAAVMLRAQHAELTALRARVENAETISSTLSVAVELWQKRALAAEAKVAVVQAQPVGEVVAWLRPGSVEPISDALKRADPSMCEHHTIPLVLSAPQPAAPAPERCAASHACDCQEAGVACQRAAPERVPLTADDLKEPKNGTAWRVEWWNESARLMLPAGSILDSFQSFKNGTLMFTIKPANGIKQPGSET